MRIVAGRFGGRRLRAPAGRATRPTADRVREAVFSILGPLEGARVLDLYAGSGALGLEALSRGAAAAAFVDRDPRAAAAVEANARALGVEVRLHRRDVRAFLAAAGERYDLVFADPPYSSAPRLGAWLSERLPAVLAPHARVVIESHRHRPLVLSLPLVVERTYGDTRIAVHRGP